MLNIWRRTWSANQKELRAILKAGTDLERAQNLFCAQHAVLHSRKMSGLEDWSYADEILTGLEEGQFRTIPEKKDHSLIWIFWHISRIEDVTMNVLVAGGTQIYLQDQWKRKLASPIDHVGNLITQEDLEKLTRTIDIQTLFNYRDAVSRQTRAIINALEELELHQKVLPGRLQRLVGEGAVLPRAEGLLTYWGKRKIYELFLMPPTRHLMTHLNEAYSIVNALD